MTLHIDVNPEVEARLKAAASMQGLEPEDYASQILQSSLPPLGGNQRAALALLKQWDLEDATTDPAELARRQSEFEELKAALNYNREISEGPNARKLFP